MPETARRLALFVQCVLLYNSVMNTSAVPATETRCLRCGRTLRKSTGAYGPKCAAKIRQAAREHALDGLTGKQAAEAREIAADGGVVPTNRENVFKVVSGDGTQIYMTTAEGHCNCRWGLRRTSEDIHVCKHVGAVRLVMVPSRRSLVKAA